MITRLLRTVVALDAIAPRRFLFDQNECVSRPDHGYCNKILTHTHTHIHTVTIHSRATSIPYIGLETSLESTILRKHSSRTTIALPSPSCGVVALLKRRSRNKIKQKDDAQQSYDLR